MKTVNVLLYGSPLFNINARAFKRSMRTIQPHTRFHDHSIVNLSLMRTSLSCTLKRCSHHYIKYYNQCVIVNTLSISRLLIKEIAMIFHWPNIFHVNFVNTGFNLTYNIFNSKTIVLSGWLNVVHIITKVRCNNFPMKWSDVSVTQIM